LAVTIFEFGDFKLDCDRLELWRAGRSLKLERKPMELLILLASREGDLVTRAEIAERLWGNEVFVDTEHGINTAIRKVRQALRDHPEQPRFVQTVMGRGYRFIGPVVEIKPSSTESARHPAEIATSTVVPARAAAAPDSPVAVENRQQRSHRRLWLILGASAAIILLCVAATLRAHWSHWTMARSAPPISDPSPFSPSTISPAIPPRTTSPTA